MAAICGIDWADEWHDVCIADEHGGRLAQRRFAHDEHGIGARLRSPHAIRILGRAWSRVLWRCWQDRVPYNPTQHRAATRHFSERG